MSLFLFCSAPAIWGTRTASACSPYPGGSSFLHRLCGGTRRAGGSPERAGRFSLNLSVGSCRARGGGQEGRHLRFLPSCAPAGQASSVRFACGKSCGFSHEKFPFLFSQNVCTVIFARYNRVRISAGFLMLFGMKLIFSKVLKRLCFYVCNPYNARMKRVIFV